MNELVNSSGQLIPVTSVCIDDLLKSVSVVIIISGKGKQGKMRPKYYTPNEVSVHNTLKDLWISFLGKVYDLTPLCENYTGEYTINIIYK